VISRLLEPLLSLHGWQAYLLIGVLVFAEDSVMLGFVFPGETAAILGGVLASKGGVSLGGILAVVVACAIVGDSAGYAIGDRWGSQLLRVGPLRKRQKGVDTALDQLSRRGALAVFVGRFSAFLRAVVPGLAGMSKMRYRIFLPANALGGICWGFLYVLLGYFVGERVEKATGTCCSWCATAAGRSARSRGPRSPPHPGATRSADRPDQAGGSRTERSPARSPASTRANSPAASSPWASVSIQRTVVGSLRSRPKRPRRGS
jgi:membrane protein DedA with SNARE-associated domain